MCIKEFDKLFNACGIRTSQNTGTIPRAERLLSEDWTATTGLSFVSPFLSNELASRIYCTTEMCILFLSFCLSPRVCPLCEFLLTIISPSSASELREHSYFGPSMTPLTCRAIQRNLRRSTHFLCSFLRNSSKHWESKLQPKKKLLKNPWRRIFQLSIINRCEKEKCIFNQKIRGKTIFRINISTTTPNCIVNLIAFECNVEGILHRHLLLTEIYLTGIISPKETGNIKCCIFYVPGCRKKSVYKTS